MYYILHTHTHSLQYIRKLYMYTYVSVCSLRLTESHLKWVKPEVVSKCVGIPCIIHSLQVHVMMWLNSCTAPFRLGAGGFFKRPVLKIKTCPFLLSLNLQLHWRCNITHKTSGWVVKHPGIQVLTTFSWPWAQAGFFSSHLGSSSALALYFQHRLTNLSRTSWDLHIMQSTIILLVLSQ